jgi:hypothetical protein
MQLLDEAMAFRLGPHHLHFLPFSSGCAWAGISVFDHQILLFDAFLMLIDEHAEHILII